jgi:D-serine deaminase-like pyridoxal phosphate-dependent protein
MSSIFDLETPEVLVDRDLLLANVERMQARMAAHQVALRPHAKTHKCIEIAQLQLARGAIGITASKVDEAIALLPTAGLHSVTLAYPIIDSRKLERLASEAHGRNIQLRIIVDSAAGVEAAHQSGAQFDIFIKIDVGLHRCGVDESAPRLLDLVRAIGRRPTLRFVGILSHAGHSYAASNRAEIAGIAAEERAIMLRVRDRLQADGHELSEISVGSTPTVLASESFDGITEARPGNYVFSDATAVRLELGRLDDVALTILATIISANDRYFIIDAGSKVLSSDLGAHGTGGAGYGLALPLERSDNDSPLRVVRLSEEHGFVERAGSDLPIGTKLRIIPNHACPVANLADRLTIVSRSEVVDEWLVAGRGKVR